MNNISKIFMYIELSGNNLPRETIEKIWSDDDVYFAEKGEMFFEFESGKKIEKIRLHDYCNIRYELLQNGLEINDIVIDFLKKHKDNMDFLSNICADIAKRIHLCIYPESEQYTFDFPIGLLNLLITLNVEIGVTILQL